MSEALEYRESDESVLVSWSLSDLPTAQHKAGLAGLFVYVCKMPEFITDPNTLFPTVESVSPLELSVRFTQASLTALLDSVYAGEKHPVKVKQKWQGRTPVEEKTEAVEENGQQRQVKFFVYEVVRPRAELISHWLGGDGENRWVVLWRDAVRGVLRAGGNTEKIYEFTSKGESPTEKSGDLKELWSGLVAAARERRRAAKPVPTSMFIGAESKSAERVDFKGEVHHNLILHLWPFVSPVYVPRAVQRKSGQWVTRNSGFVMAVPEVAHLTDFRELIDVHWRRLQGSDDNSSYRPPKSLIDTVVEGGMDFLHSLAIDRLKDMDEGYFFSTVPQVELYHLEKRGNSVRMLAAETLRPSGEVLKKFDQIRMSRARLNAMFKRLLLRNLLDGLPWYARAAETLFTRFPVELFIRSDKSPRFAQNFGSSAREQFKLKERNDMSEQINIARKVYDIVGEYVAKRAEKRSGVKRDELPKKDGKVDWSTPSAKTKDYLEAREKMATDAFLAIRGRNSEEFVDYFVGSICAVPQFMGTKGISPEQGFIAMSDALHESESKRTEMKNLTMLALCAHAWRQRFQAEEPNNTPQSE